MENKIKKILLIGGIILSAVVMVVFTFSTVFSPAARYKMALKNIDKGNYAKAFDMLTRLEGYDDSEELLRNFRIGYKLREYEHDNDNYYYYERDLHFEYDDKCRLIYEELDYWKGNYSYKYEYHDNDTISRKETFAGETLLASTDYDEQGNIIKETRHIDKDNTYYDDDVYIPANNKRYEYIYNSDGTVNKYYYYTDDGLISTYYYEYEYDNKGNLVLEEEYNEYDTLVYCVKYEYDKEGNLVREETANYGTFFYSILSTEYEYDKKGHLVKKSVYDISEEEPYLCYEFKYGKLGKQSKEVRYDADGTVLSEKNFNDAGFMIKETYLNAEGEKKTKEYNYTDPVYYYVED